MSITPTTLAALRDAASKATPGPWSIEDGDPSSGMIRGPHDEHLAAVSTIDDFSCVDEDSENYDQVVTECEANVVFIALANPATVIGLLDEVERLRKLVSRALNLATSAADAGRCDAIGDEHEAIRKEIEP